MDRIAGGGYKRRVQWIILGLGLVVAIAVNADTITIANSLSHDMAMRNSLVAAAQEYAKADQSAPKKPAQPKAALPATNPPTPAQDPKPKPCEKDENSPECRVAKNLEQIRKLGLPIGWNWDDPRTVPKEFPAWLIKFLGWLLTATAVSLGAPFWFDVLNKFISARSTLKPSGKSPEEPKQAGT